MEKQFEVTDHTADIGITAYGASQDELMANAARGMMSLMTDCSSIGGGTSKKVELHGSDEVALLVDWLNELLYIFDVERLLFGNFIIDVSGGNKLVATCTGEKYDPAKHRLKREIKAATYHNLYIVREKGIYSASIIFDI